MSLNIRRISYAADKTPVFDFDPALLRIGNVKKLNKGMFVSITYDGGDLIFETPPLHSPMGLSSFDDAVDKKSLFLSCRNEESPEMAAFIRAIESFQEEMVRQVAKRDVMNKGFSEETLLGIMSRVVKKKGDYPPALQLALRFQSDVPTFKAYNLRKKDEAGHPATLNVLDTNLKGATVSAIFSANTAWFVGSNWGISTKAVQLAIRLPGSHLEDFAFKNLPVGDSDDGLDEDDVATE